MNLQEFFSQYPKVALGFSGGVDSAYLLYAAKSCGVDVQPYFIKSQFQPDFELEDARELAAQLQVELKVIYADALASDLVRANPANRCYYCKQNVFGLLKQAAERDGYRVIIDGTNGSDQVDDRPGMKALTEMQVLSPLRLCGMTKSEIREKSKAAGLFTWDKPSYACLATRVPTGEELTDEKLSKVEKAEKALMDLGFSDFRIRLFHDGARIQLKGPQMEKAIAERDSIKAGLRPYFEIILLDLEER
jgi:uncharacterized protein